MYKTNRDWNDNGYKASNIQFSHSVVSDSLRPHGLQHARPLCPSPSPGVCQVHVHWISDAIQPSHPVVPFSSCPQSFPTSESFPMSQFFSSGGQSIGASAWASVFPMTVQAWFPLELTRLISCPRDFSRVLSSITVWKHQFLCTLPFLWSNSHICIGKLHIVQSS